MKYLVIAMLVLVAGCSKPAEHAEIRGAGGFEVQTLFTHEGCTVYRFYDHRAVYFTKCVNADSSSTSRDYRTGKVTRRDGVQTVYVPESN